MNKLTSLALTALLLAPMASLHAAEVVNLRCEYRENPLGIDVTKPRLSWVLAAPQSEISNLKSQIKRSVAQTAYQVLVASSEELLKKDNGDLWDSGKVESDESMNVEYKGKAVKSGQGCFWKVRVWTSSTEVRGQRSEDGEKAECSGWSSPAMWTMGVLKPEDWGSAKWIKSDLELYDYQKELKEMADHDRESEDAMWARAPGIRSMTAGIDEAPAVWLRKEFSAPGKPLRSARVCVSGLGYYELYINGTKANDHHLNVAPYDYDKAVPYQVHDITQLLRSGDNAIGVMLGNGYFNPVSSVAIEGVCCRLY